MDQFQHGDTVSGTQVDGLYAFPVRSKLQSLQVSHRQVHHMEVISLAGTVGSGVIAAEDGQFLQLSRSHTADVGHQVIGNAVGVVPQQTGFMGTDGVKVAQQHGTEIRMGRHIVGKDPLNHHLGPAVGAGGLDGRHLFLIRMGVVGAIDRCGGGEDKLLATELLHHFQQRHGAVQIVTVVLQRLFHTLTHRLKGRKVDDGVDLVGREHRPQAILILAVQLIEGRACTGDGFDPVNYLCLCVGQIVHDHRPVTCLNEFHYGMAADVSGTAGYQNIHLYPSRFT